MIGNFPNGLSELLRHAWLGGTIEYARTVWFALVGGLCVATLVFIGSHRHPRT